MRQVICKKDACELVPKHSTEQGGGGLIQDDVNYAMSLRSSTKSKKRATHRKKIDQKGAGFGSRWSSEETPTKRGRKKLIKKKSKKRSGRSKKKTNRKGISKKTTRRRAKK